MIYSGRHLLSFDDDRRKRLVNIDLDSEILSSAVASKVLRLQLSDENDLYFLYTVRITLDDFNEIKSQQGLLVDFSGFEQKVIDLLLLCSKEETSANPKYSLKFSTLSNDGNSFGILQIIEATNFKYLTHLVLSLRAGDDETLKAYLISLIKDIKSESSSELSRMRANISELTTALSKSEQSHKSITEQFEAFKLECAAKAVSCERMYQEKIKGLESNRMNDLADYERKLETEKKYSYEAQQNIKHDLTGKINALTEDCQSLREKLSIVQCDFDKTKDQLKAAETRNLSLNDDLTTLRIQLKSLDQSNSTQSTTITRLEARILVLENEVNTKDTLISKTQEMLTTEQEQKARYQEELQKQTRQLENSEKNSAKTSEELSKANDIIKRLQSEVKSYHTKAKLRGQVAAEQERLLSSKENELQELRSDVERLKTELNQSLSKVDSLTNQLQQNTNALEEAQKTIKTNENIIAWLNRQISENQIGQVQQRLKSSGFPTPVNGITVNHQSTPSYGLSSTLAGLPIGSNALNGVRSNLPFILGSKSSYTSSTGYPLTSVTTNPIDSRATTTSDTTATSTITGTPTPTSNGSASINHLHHQQHSYPLNRDNGNVATMRTNSPQFMNRLAPTGSALPDSNSNRLNQMNGCSQHPPPDWLTKSNGTSNLYRGATTETGKFTGSLSQTSAAGSDTRLLTHAPYNKSSHLSKTTSKFDPISTLADNSSALTAKSHQTDSQHSLHQQSLTSAYFPQTLSSQPNR